MICSSCGATVADGTAFCGSCGRPVVGYNVGQPPSPAAPVISQTAPMGGVSAAGATVYAGFWLRFVAYLIDSALALLVFGVIGAVLIAIVGVGSFRNLAEETNSPNPALPVALFGIIFFLMIVAIVASWLYFALMESSQTQGTLGKMALSLAVTDTQGKPVTFGRASGRFFAKIITGMIPFAIGYIMAGFTEKKQALHDMIASCLVVRKI
jgi:uncharacterized RDD family membrane protein YckC